MPSEITFPDPSGYTETPWTDPNGKQWIADNKGRWSAYKADTGGGSGAWADITGKPAAITALAGTNTGDNAVNSLYSGLDASKAPVSTTVTLTGDQTVSGKKLTNFREGVLNIGNSGTSQTLSITAASVQQVTLTGNCTFTMPAIVAGQSFLIDVIGNGSAYTATFTDVDWGGTTPAVSTGSGDRNTFVFRAKVDGSGWLGAMSGGSGPPAWDDITGKPAAVTALSGTNTGDETTSTIKTKLGISTLSGVNTGDQDLSGLLSTSTASSTYAPISTTVTLAGTQTITGAKTFTNLSAANPYFTGETVIESAQLDGEMVFGQWSSIAFNGTTYTYGMGSAAAHRTALGLGALATSTDAANLTGNIARARIDNALSANAAPIVATTVTASGAVTIGGGTAITTSGITGAQLVAAATPAAARTHIELEETYLPAASDAATRGNNTLADDPVLAGVALAANSRYHIRCLAIFTCPTTAGIACRLALSAAPSAESSQYYGHSTRAGTLDLYNIVQSTGLGSTVTRPSVTTSPLPFYFDICINTTAAITVALQYSQVTTDAGNPVTRKGGSWISVKKLNR